MASHPELPYWSALAVQATVWAWPLYEMQRMRAATAPRRTESDGFAGDDPQSPWRWFNTFIHARQRLRPGGSRVVLPNNDTLYSNAWLDLTENQGLVVDLPDMGDRYHVLGLMDFYTNPANYFKKPKKHDAVAVSELPDVEEPTEAEIKDSKPLTMVDMPGAALTKVFNLIGDMEESDIKLSHM